jgi:hypothetical protein
MRPRVINLDLFMANRHCIELQGGNSKQRQAAWVKIPGAQVFPPPRNYSEALR